MVMIDEKKLADAIREEVGKMVQELREMIDQLKERIIPKENTDEGQQG